MNSTVHQQQTDCFCCTPAMPNGDCACLQRYSFDQHALLLTMVCLTGQLAQHAAFPQVGHWGACTHHQHIASAQCISSRAHSAYKPAFQGFISA
jgi:hypothetical protein